MKKKLMVAIPAYNCARQIGRVLRQFDAEVAPLFEEVVVIDNRSRDGTIEAAIAAAKDNCLLPISVLRNEDNYNLGGSHKVAFARCLEKGYDGVVILHGDDQGRIADFADLQDDIARTDARCILGARFHPRSSLNGYPLARIAGNIVFNWIYALCAGARVHDMGSGLNYYSRQLIERGIHLRMPDDLTFNNCMLLATYAARETVLFKPISWREEDQTSNARLVRQSLRLLNYLFLFVFDREKFLTEDFRAAPRTQYPSTQIFGNLEISKATP
jgi:glycosyltransferase involved in cell wall biosynthesis